MFSKFIFQQYAILIFPMVFLIHCSSEKTSKKSNKKSKNELQKISTIADTSKLLIIKKSIPKKLHSKANENTKNFKIPILDLKMVYVKKGSFQMGGIGKGETWQKSFPVLINHDYWISTYEITQAQYNFLMKGLPLISKQKQIPKVNVAWSEALQFCKKLTIHKKLKDILIKGYEIRLPTEAEWEYAARGGSKSKNFLYSGSNKLDTVGWNQDNSQDKLHRVGLKMGNELGIFDMTGNASEFCLDSCQDYSQIKQVNPFVSTGEGRVIRGGSFSCSFCGNFIRHPSTSKGGSEIGFRIVLSKIIPPKILFNHKPEISRKSYSSKSKIIKGYDYNIPQRSLEFVYVNTNCSTNVKYKHIKNFWIGRYEVTQKDYTNIMGKRDFYYVGVNKPADFITWKQAYLFSKSLTKKESKLGRLPKGMRYRIPTIDEWEFAALGGCNSNRFKYSGSNSIASVGWYTGNSKLLLKAVGQLKPNQLGIYDMSGNIAEWCSYKPNWTKPQREIFKEFYKWGYLREIKGGSFNTPSADCNILIRPDTSSVENMYLGNSGNEQEEDFGFRIVLGY
jgi:formylglycine-generating enzyme required for sulfatase activity